MIPEPIYVSPGSVMPARYAEGKDGASLVGKDDLLALVAMLTTKLGGAVRFTPEEILAARKLSDAGAVTLYRYDDSPELKVELVPPPMAGEVAGEPEQ